MSWGAMTDGIDPINQGRKEGVGERGGYGCLGELAPLGEEEGTERRGRRRRATIH